MLIMIMYKLRLDRAHTLNCRKTTKIKLNRRKQRIDWFIKMKIMADILFRKEYICIINLTGLD